MAPGGKTNDTRTRLPCWTLSSTGPSQHSTGNTLSYTSIMLESRPVGHTFKRIKSFIFMYNILILMLATNFFSKKKKKKKNHTVEIKSPQQCARITLQSLQVFISCLELGVQWGQRGILFMLVDLQRDLMHTEHVCFLSIYKEISLGTYKPMNLSAEDKWIYF